MADRIHGVTGDVRKFLGGMNLATQWPRQRRFNATVPLARLTVTRASITLRMAFLATRLPSKVIVRGEVQEVFPSKGLLTAGVGIASAGGEEDYFWTFRVRATVKALQELGYPITASRRPGLGMLLGFGRRS